MTLTQLLYYSLHFSSILSRLLTLLISRLISNISFIQLSSLLSGYPASSLHPFALGARFRAWLPLGDQRVSQLSSGDVWSKIHPNFCLRHRFSLLTSDDSGHHPKMCLRLIWQQSISGRCGILRNNLFETLANELEFIEVWIFFVTKESD